MSAIMFCDHKDIGPWTWKDQGLAEYFSTGEKLPQSLLLN